MIRRYGCNGVERRVLEKLWALKDHPNGILDVVKMMEGVWKAGGPSWLAIGANMIREVIGELDYGDEINRLRRRHEEIHRRAQSAEPEVRRLRKEIGAMKREHDDVRDREIKANRKLRDAERRLTTLRARVRTYRDTLEAAGYTFHGELPKPPVNHRNGTLLKALWDIQNRLQLLEVEL